MAQGRMIAKKICLNKHIDELSSDISRLAFTWTIPHLDKNGRIHGDPCVLKSLIFPRRTDIDPEMMRQMINEWAKAELIQLYEIQGDVYIEFPKFRVNQPGLKLDREPDSSIPSPADGRRIAAIPPADGRQLDGEVPPQIKLKKIKLNKNSVRRQTGGKPAADCRQEGAPSAPADAGIDDDLFPPVQEEDQGLAFYHAIEESFLTKNDGRFTDYGKEGAAIKNLMKKAQARAPDNPAAFAAQMIAEFWKLKETGNAFWKGQPFLPSALNAASIWDRVLETLRTEQPDPVAMAVARGENA